MSKILGSGTKDGDRHGKPEDLRGCISGEYEADNHGNYRFEARFDLWKFLKLIFKGKE